jgi:deoxyribonuclease V
VTEGLGAAWSGEWPRSAVELDAEQVRIAGMHSRSWRSPSGPLLAGGCFLAFATGQQGPGRAGDRGWVGAAVVRCPDLVLVDGVVVACVAGAPYDPGRLALREGPALAAAVEALTTRPDVLLVDATGRDHPRGAGLALHLGARLGLPTVGVTHRPLRAAGADPGPDPGDASPLLLDGNVVGYWLRTRQGARPVAVHAGWRVDPPTALDVVRRCSGAARTPEPLRQARVLARTARALAEGRVSR